LAILTPFLCAVIVPFLFKYVKRIHTGWFVLAVPLSLFVYFINRYPFHSPLEPVVQSVPWIPQLDFHFAVYMDSLSLLFALIITGIGCLVVLYSIYYMSKDREALHNFYFYLLCFMGAMLGVVLSDNLMVFYLFWEFTSFSSFLLIAYWYQRKRSRHGAAKALLLTVTGGFSLLLGFLMIHAALGTFSIRGIIAEADRFAEHPLFIPAMGLILLGAFAKSAQFPFHIWLPDAMEAPTPISAYLHSATMVKAGVYLAARMTPVFGGHKEWFWITVIFGIITLFWGSFLAIRQIDLKAMLAFSTISQLGMMMAMLGIGSLALAPDLDREQALLFSGAVLAAIFHLFNHSIFKGSLFMVVGILDHELGTRDIRKLGGLMSFMPISFTLTVVGAFSMAGLPPFNGFLSKEMFFTSALSVWEHLDWAGAWIPLMGWIASIFTFVYCMMLVFKTFTGPFKPQLLDKPPHEPPVGMLIPPVVLACLAILVFFAPNALSRTVLEPSMHAVLPGLLPAGETFDAHIAAWHGPTAELFMTIGIVVIGTLLFRSSARWVRVYEYLPSKFTLNGLYDLSIHGLERVSASVTRTYMTGNVRHYLIYIFGFFIVTVGGIMLIREPLPFDFSGNAEIYPFEYAIGFLIVAASVYLLFSKTRLNSIIALGAVGFLISLFYVVFRAPDLALTQLVVETISTSLFLLCFYFLPKLKEQLSTLPFRFTNLIISVAVGLIMTLIGLSALGHRMFEPISGYFEQSYELAGAKNIVNAILVDFRGFDTMLEIVVLFAAGIGVFTLIKFRRSRRGDS
jgi:multicomponent Na+:H+ antiporter subunit A